jgi:hypothetical protein
VEVQSSWRNIKKGRLVRKIDISAATNSLTLALSFFSSSSLYTRKTNIIIAYFILSLCLTYMYYYMIYSVLK